MAAIDTYDRDCVHTFGDYQIAFNINEFRPGGLGGSNYGKATNTVGKSKASWQLGLILWKNH